MKKWIGLYIILCLAGLGLFGGLLGMRSAKRADFGMIQQAGGYHSQVIETGKHTYVLYQDPEQRSECGKETCGYQRSCSMLPVFRCKADKERDRWKRWHPSTHLPQAVHPSLRKSISLTCLMYSRGRQSNSDKKALLKPLGVS